MEAEDRTDRALILAGRHPVLEALRSRTRPIEEVLVETEARDRHGDILALARQEGVRFSRVPRVALTALVGSSHHQGVVARVAPREYAELEDLLAVPAARGEPALFLALDQVQDPGNVGNLLRTAEALGVHGALVPRHQAAGLTPHVVRAAAGALEYLPVARVGNLGQALERLKQAGCWIVGAVAEGGEARPSQAVRPPQPPWTADFRGAVALVLGSEGRGLRSAGGPDLRRPGDDPPGRARGGPQRRRRGGGPPVRGAAAASGGAGTPPGKKDLTRG